MHLQPLYRRGPDWAHRIDSAQWPPGQQYGPPFAGLDHLREFDCRMFALYFLVTESLATYLGYRITQHLLRGRGLVVLAPTLRVWIVFVYCALKIRLIDYAFHGSLYSIVSTITAFCFALCTLIAIVFHFGPLQFVFADSRRHSGRFSIWQLLNELKNFVVKQHFHEYALDIASRKSQIVDSSSIGPVAKASSDAPGVALVPWPLLGSFELNIKTWNEWFVHHTLKSIVLAAKKRGSPVPATQPFAGLFESRFVVLMLQGGLVLDVVLRQATASLMYRAHKEGVYPFELVVRILPSAESDHRGRFYFNYAECPKLVGTASPAQKAALLAMLVQLNAAAGLRIDVPLRALRCKNFMDASCHKEECFRRTKPRQNLSSRLESAFG